MRLLGIVQFLAGLNILRPRITTKRDYSHTHDNLLFGLKIAVGYCCASILTLLLLDKGGFLRSVGLHSYWPCTALGRSHRVERN